jgi:plasmid stability protein
MAQVLVRNLDEATVASLKGRALANGHSLEQELRLILTEAAKPTREEVLATMEEIRAMSRKPVAVDIEALIREDRDR